MEVGAGGGGSDKGTPGLMNVLAGQVGHFGGVADGESLGNFAVANNPEVDSAAHLMVSQFQAASAAIRSTCSDTANTITRTAANFAHADGR